MMNDTPNNHFFETSDFLFAAFLIARGILYFSISWPTPQRAVFIFRQPPEDLIIAWQKADDSVSTRALQDSMNFLRDELRKDKA